MSNQSRERTVRRMLVHGVFTAVVGISLGCGASVFSPPTGPTPTPITVIRPDSPGYTVIAATDTVARGSQLSVNWTAGIGYVGDSISLSKVGDTRTAEGLLRPTDGATSGNFTFTAPTDPGQYEFRYLLEDFSVAARSSLVTVQ